jgi:hypothetical protein
MSLALVRHEARMRRWARYERAVAHFEEEYAASQLYKTDWERWQGDAFATRAEAIVRETEPL